MIEILHELWVQVLTCLVMAGVIVLIILAILLPMFSSYENIA